MHGKNPLNISEHPEIRGITSINGTVQKRNSNTPGFVDSDSFSENNELFDNKDLADLEAVDILPE